jgi:hypothetical protein
MIRRIEIIAYILLLAASLVPHNAESRSNRGGAVLTNGYDSSLSINSSGQVINGHGTPIQLRGSNITGMYFGYISGITGISPWANPDTPGDPNWVMMKAWRVNSVRIPINVQSFLGLQYQLLTGASNAAGAWSGTSVNADLGGDTKLTLQNAITYARSVGIYPIIDAHVSAPQFTFSSSTQYLPATDQPPAMDQQTYSVFWGGGSSGLIFWLANTFGSPAWNAAHGFNGGAAGSQYNSAFGGFSGFQDVILELGNELYLSNFGFTLTTIAGTFGNPAWKANNGGSNYSTTNGGTPPDTPGHTSLGAYTSGQEFVSLFGGNADFFMFQNNSATRGVPSGFTCTSLFGSVAAICQSWQIYGTQAAVNSVRATGATNIIVYPVQGFSSALSNIQYSMPVDTMSPPQIGVQYHAYQSGASGYPSTIDPGVGTSAALAWPAGVAAGTGGLSYAVPVFLDETGTSCGPALGATDTYINTLQVIADAAKKGTFHFYDYAINKVLPLGSGTQQFCDTIYGAATNITASISNGSGAAGYILTVTSGTVAAGQAITSGASVGAPTIMPFGFNGTTGAGGNGTYYLSGKSQLVSSSTMQVSTPAATNGQGNATFKWLVNHTT